MKNKILKTFLCFVLFGLLLVTVSYAETTEYPTTVKENVNQYPAEGAFIIGSTRFDTQQVITASKLFKAGVNESNLYNDLDIDKEIDDTLYYYTPAGWMQLGETPGFLSDADAAELEENLNIFFENNEVKTIQVAYDGNVVGVDDKNVTYDSENNRFIVPATTFKFTFTETKIVDEKEVIVAQEATTNMDKAITTESGKVETPVIGEVSENFVAKVGSEYFEDLALAIAKANTENEVVLIKDVELEKGIEITNTVILNLNEKTLSAHKDMESLALIKVDGGNLTINGEGTVNSASQGNDYSMAVWVTGTGVATINGGTFTNVGAKSFEDDGTTPNNNELIYANGSGKIYINGGTFTGNTENTTHGVKYTLNLKDQDNTIAAIVVKGGTYTAYDPANSKSENPTKNLVVDGYKSVKDGDTYKVLPYDAEKVTDEAELRTLIAKDGTVKLGGNIELTEGIVVTKNVTIDLNGKTLSAHKDMESLALIKVDGGNLTINGEGTVNSASQGNDYSMAVWVTGTGVATINGGTFTNVGAKSFEDDGTTPNNNELIYANGSGKIYINGGTFTGNTENTTHGVKYTLNLRDDSQATIIVTGGTYTAYDPANSASENPRMNFLADGYKVVLNDNKYTVVKLNENDIAISNGVAYQELQTAVDNASKIKLLQNIELAEGIVVTKNVTIDLNGKTLSAHKDMESLALIKVDGGNLTINGEGTVNSASQGNDYSMAVWVTGTGVATINGGTFTNVGAKSFEDDGTTPNNNELIYANGSGKIYINGGTFTGNTENTTHGVKYTLNLKDQDNTIAAIVVKGGTFTGYDPANSKSENPTKNLVAEGYEVTVKDNVYTVVEKAN